MKRKTMLSYLLALIIIGASLVYSQSTVSYTAVPTVASAVANAPSLVPNIKDSSAPDSQVSCPGYRAKNIQQTPAGLTADLHLAGPECNTYGLDIEHLSLLVEYQAKQRLHVQITPRYLAPANTSHFFLDERLTGYPGVEHHGDDDLLFEYKNSPSFQFQILRSSRKEVIFSTYGKKLVYQNQFLELATAMEPNYNVYGLAENIHNFRLGNNYTQTFWAVDRANTIDGNVYGTHPFYVENRYGNSTTPAQAHGVYARNGHAQEWLLRPDNITYRAIGGAFDFYFLSGPTPMDVVAQYQAGIVGTPQMQQYWTFGFHQCRWGYENWTVLQEIIDNYRNAGIQLETIWNDIDYMDQYRDFTNGAMNYPVPAGQEFLSRLHKNGQHYVPIVDSNIYAPNPENASDVYEPFERGQSMNAFIRNGDDGLYYGSQWPGFSVWVDWLVPQSYDFWTSELVDYHKQIQYDGIWIDLNEVSSYCDGSCGSGERNANAVHPPFLLPGDLGNVELDYPESFDVTNKTEAVIAAAAASSQASASSAQKPATSTVSFTRVPPAATARNLNFPPYVINNVNDGHSLVRGTISPNATHNDMYNSTEYDYHNLFSHMILNATHDALLHVFAGRRPFVIGRSTFAGSGTVAAHWGGDNRSKWGAMYFSIAQAFTFMIAGIPMFGVDTCGFTENTDMELCTRWMELSAFFPFYRNHNDISAIPQEAYIWASTARATRTVMNIRYSLLPYMYTLFYAANENGDMVMRPLQFEFPEEEHLKAVDNQFLLGPALLITPVLEPLVSHVKGVFPGIDTGTIWYDWYTLQPEVVRHGENKTLSAPLEHINIHVRGGSILPMQQPGYTTAESRTNPWSLLIVLDEDGKACGDLYLDDGYSVNPDETKHVSLRYEESKLYANATGEYEDGNALANVTIAGFSVRPEILDIGADGDTIDKSGVKVDYDKGVLRVTGLEKFTSDGAWKGKGFAMKFSF